MVAVHKPSFIQTPTVSQNERSIQTGRPQSRATPWAANDTFQTAAPSWTAKVAAPRTIDRVQRTQDAAPASAVARDPSLKPVTDAMLARLRSAGDIKIGGQTPEALFRKQILDNPKVTDDQIRAMSRLQLKDVASSKRSRRYTLRKFPNVQQSDSHKMTVALMHGATGIPKDQLSNAIPSLGVTGTTRFPVFFRIPKSTKEKLSTSLHDFTSHMHSAGVKGVQKAVWGWEGTVTSALKSFFWGIPK